MRLNGWETMRGKCLASWPSSCLRRIKRCRTCRRSWNIYQSRTLDSNMILRTRLTRRIPIRKKLAKSSMLSTTSALSPTNWFFKRKVARKTRKRIKMRNSSKKQIMICLRIWPRSFKWRLVRSVTLLRSMTICKNRTLMEPTKTTTRLKARQKKSTLIRFEDF